MARVEVHADRVVIQLTAAEKTLSLRRRDVVIDRAQVTSAIITSDPWVWLRGVRAPGTHFPGRLAYGVWRNLSGRDFALLRSGLNAVIIDLDASANEDDPGWVSEFDGFARVMISTAHATELIRALRLEDADQPVFTTNTA